MTSPRIRHFGLGNYPKLDYRTWEANGVWLAMHNARAIEYAGDTEHAAIQAMLNGLLELVAAGHMVASRPFAVIGGERVLPLNPGDPIVYPEIPDNGENK